MESFEEFKNSFSYGSRTDLSFKFLKRLSPEDAANFVRMVFDDIGHTFDDGDLGRIHQTVYEWQVKAYSPAPGAVPTFSYNDGPFTALNKPLNEARVGLLTSSGHFTQNDDPRPFGVEGMSQTEATERIDDFLKSEPQLSKIHRDIEADRLRVRHGGYDIRSAERDHNVTLPRDALVEAETQGRIREFADTMYSFVGATAQGRLRKHALPKWIEELHGAGLDALLLVPV